MRVGKRFLCGLALVLALVIGSSQANAQGMYAYAHNDGEYVISLPDAPSAVTIWADETEVPYLDNPPKYGAVGEVATFKRVDPDTGDMFETVVTFLRADRDFLLSLTQEKMEQALRDEYKDMPLDKITTNFSSGTDTLKWATLTAFSVDENNNLFYNAAHYLTGLETMYVIKIRYNVENKKFQEFYDAVTASIKFTGK